MRKWGDFIIMRKTEMCVEAWFLSIINLTHPPSPPEQNHLWSLGKRFWVAVIICFPKALICL